MSLLTIVQTACIELNLVVPSVVTASTDSQVQQLWGLANRAARKVAETYPWQAMREEVVFTTVAAEAQPLMTPADLDRWVPNSFFNRSTRREIRGPITVRQWQAIKAQPVASSVYLAFIERQGVSLITPAPAAGQTIAGEYVSKNWANSATGTPQASFLADSDVSYLDEDLIALGLIWRWLRRKGLDYAEEMADYEGSLELKQARDGGATALSMAPQPIDPLRANLPDGSFGQ